jgi:hypothetical protein
MRKRLNQSGKKNNIADERHAFTGRDGKLDTAQRFGRAETAAHAAHFETGGIPHANSWNAELLLGFLVI